MSVNIAKMNYHHDRAQILAKAMKKADSTPDGKMAVDLDGKGKTLVMTRGEMQSQYDRELSACRDAGSMYGS